jgi:hypothetical protein
MKMMHLAWMAVAAALLACGPNVDDPNDNPVDPGETPVTPVDPPAPSNVVGPLSVEGSFAGEIVSGLPAWAQGDAISCWGAGGTHAKLTLKSVAGGKATFEGEGDSLGPYYAVYPYRENNELKSGKLLLDVPSEQKIAGGTVAPGAIAAVAVSDGKSLSFRNVCGLLRINIDVEGVSRIQITGPMMAGRATVDPATGKCASVDSPHSEIDLLPEGASFAPGTYYAAVLPVERSALSFNITGSSGVKKCTFSIESADIPAGGCFSAGDVGKQNVSWAYRIGSYDDLKAWVADKPNWNPEGDEVELTADIDMKDEPWTPLTDSYPGVFDGKGHCISHINIQSSSLAHTGFFGKGYAKTIKNLVLGSADGKTYDGTSCIKCGFTTTSASSYWCYAAPITQPEADVENVTNFIPVTVTKETNRSSRAGGIVSWVTGKVSITGCRNYGDVTIEEHEITTGSSYKYVTAGGIIGGQNTENSDVTVKDCVNYGKVSASNHSCYGLGGIVGLIYSTAKQLTIDNCANEGGVELLYSATQNDMFAAGGIIGKVACKAGATVPVIRGCTNKGHVRSEAVHQHYVGGIAGRADGVSITGCRNEGKVEIDHSAHNSTRFQNVGGILAAAMSDGGANEIKDNVNTGEVTMLVTSSGHNKTPSSSTTFYGVNAGGILGMGGGVTALSGNRCEGKVSATNAFSNGTYPAVVHAGGILGYDYGAVDGFSGNEFTGTVEAVATASGVPSEVYAGGIAGRLRAASLTGSKGAGTVSASGPGSVYAGSVAGYNGGSVGSCTYGGTVNGAAADGGNIVGGGNPVQGGDTPGPSGKFGVDRTSIEFEGTGFASVPLVISAGDKNVSISLSGLEWLKTDNIPATIAAGQSQTVSILPRTGNVDQVRNGTLTVTEAGGNSVSVAISQNDLYASVDGFPARWEIEKGVTYTEGNAAGQRWLNEGVAATVAASDAPSNAPGVGYISAGSTVGRNLVYSVAPSGTQNISIGNLGEGDYIQFSVPVVSLPAGTDVDFMVTINTNNNKTPKYWLFEYWDDGKWNAQPRYTASEDASVKYSLDVYDYDSKNHRTYITTFRLLKAVSGQFVKMRLRAVGNINCNGAALTPTPNAYMNFPCTTYRSCEIVAYPGVPAKESKPVKILQLGNSFTYYHGSAFKLKQICRAEGHATDVRINVKGSQEFAEHLDALPFSQRLVAEGGYDVAILQDGSYYHAEYALGSKDALQDVTPEYTPEQILDYTKRLSAAIKEKSPSARVVLESVWSYPYKSTGRYLGFGSFEQFDAMQWAGSCAIAEADPNVDLVSPIGKAFALARSADYGFTDSYNWLLYTDNYHPHRYGSYLKACVNYLLIFGEPFGAHPADCDVPPAVAAKLREVAMKIVLN